MGYKSYWRIALIVLVIGLLAFGGPMVVLASSFGPIFLTNDDFDSGDFGAPDPSCAWLVEEYDFPDDCDLMGVKINDPISGTFAQQTGEIEFGCGATDFNVVLDIDENTFNFVVSGYTVYYVWVKAGPGGNLYGYPDGTQSGTGLVSPVDDSISHITFYFCEGEEELTVSKTVNTYFEREHFWDIDKRVETDKEETVNGTPKIWLDGPVDASVFETASWTVDVSYEGFEDSGWNVFGTVTIFNSGDLPAVITGVDDVLGGTTIDVDFGVTFPYTLPVGETLTGNYSEDVYIEGSNEVTVNTERDSYSAESVAIVWSEDPDEEINETVKIEDISSEFGTVALGSVTAPDGDSFTYSEEFAWVDYQDLCGQGFEIANTATILETEQSSSALLKINIRCEDLNVTKDVVTYFEREHFWDIDKRVETDKEETVNGTPKIWLDGPVDASVFETATWTVDVSYEGFEVSGWNVSGTVTIFNSGDLPAVITGVDDVLGGTTIDVDFGVTFPYTLPVGETLTGTYSEDVYIEGSNEVTVNTERDSYSAEPVAIVWSEDPDEEINETVKIEDISSEFGTVALGSVTAPDGDSFTYSEEFAWVDYQDLCGQGFEIANTATILETEQSSSALLKINIRCEDLNVTKDVVTYFEREHFWDIDKNVVTDNGHTVDDGIAKIWLFTDGSGDETATWIVDVTYEDYEDSGFNVSGTVTIENTGELDAVITGVDDVLGGTTIDVDFGITFPYTLPVGETLTGTYSEDGYIEGSNEVTVNTERDSYSAEPVAIVWSEDPDEEINETVKIEDISSEFGTVALGSVTAPDGDSFTYYEEFAWVDYQDLCGQGFEIANTATILETEQSAEATLKVNVQCFIYDSAWAEGDDAISFCEEGFNNWGWTNPIIPGTYEMDLWAGAAQCDTSRGTLVGSVTVVYDDDGEVTVTFNVETPYTIEETQVYAGYYMFPTVGRGRVSRATVAPGQYSNDSPFDGSEVYVIAHAVVGLPDPNFGPE